MILRYRIEASEEDRHGYGIVDGFCAHDNDSNCIGVLIRDTTTQTLADAWIAHKEQDKDSAAAIVTGAIVAQKLDALVREDER